MVPYLIQDSDFLSLTACVLMLVAGMQSCLSKKDLQTCQVCLKYPSQ